MEPEGSTAEAPTGSINPFVNCVDQLQVINGYVSPLKPELVDFTIALQRRCPLPLWIADACL